MRTISGSVSILGYFSGPICGLVVLLGCAGCNGNPPSQQQVQQQAEQTTATVKQDAKQAVAATREAAGTAAQDVNAVAAGVKSGLNDSSAPGGNSTLTAGASIKDALKANLNTSTQVRLAMLPGVSMDKAGEIMARRPYTSGRQLVSRGILTPTEYAGIAKDVVVQ